MLSQEKYLELIAKNTAATAQEVRNVGFVIAILLMIIAGLLWHGFGLSWW